MVEATLILPVVILSVMAVINIVIFLYSEVEMNAKMHVKHKCSIRYFFLHHIYQ